MKRLQSVEFNYVVVKDDKKIIALLVDELYDPFTDETIVKLDEPLMIHINLEWDDE